MVEGGVLMEAVAGEVGVIEVCLGVKGEVVVVGFEHECFIIMNY